MRRREEALINDDYILTLNKRAEPERDSAHVSSAKILIGGPRSWAMVFSLLQPYFRPFSYSGRAHFTIHSVSRICLRPSLLRQTQAFHYLSWAVARYPQIGPPKTGTGYGLLAYHPR
ncbi:hypothetical protein AFLA_006201 [Aspergillus flavus NRRL3357]|nr:hypothetical protein AFLA_006201 [Aspergillus flavus NRRL3357]